METNNYKKVLDLIYTSIISEGGDGDAIWLSKYAPLSDIMKLINEYNTVNNTGWEVKDNDTYLFWGHEQEGATITCDKNLFDSQPNWIILRIEY